MLRDIGLLQDRGRRANEREFSALAETYDNLEDLFDATNQCVNLYVSAPNLGRMDDEALTRFLDENEFPPGEKATLQNAKDKPTAFTRVMTFRAIALPQTAYDGTLLDRQSIFVPTSLADRLRAVGDLCPKGSHLSMRNLRGSAQAKQKRPPEAGGLSRDFRFTQSVLRQGGDARLTSAAERREAKPAEPGEHHRPG
jgi:hypothetical protein